MTIPPENGTSTESSAASPLSKIRELFAGALAMLIAVAFALALYQAFRYIGQDTKFTQAKDLVGIVTGLIGVVLGYYFQKSSSDPQIESATKTAEAATKQAAKSEVVVNAAKDAVKEVRDAATDMAGGDPAMGAAMSAPPPAVRLQRALQRADAVLRM